MTQPSKSSPPTKNRFKGIVPRAWRFAKRLFLILFIAQLIYIFLLKWIYPPITMTQFGDMVYGWFHDYGFHRDYVSEADISPNARLAVMASEDQLFPEHGGFDWKNIEKAEKYNQKHPGRVHGASTISQQTAKNVFLWQGRNYIRKGLEVYFTKMIEWTWGKRRILNTYLNVIQMGQGIYGIEAASQHYFHKPAKSLSRAQAALIAACLPNPVRFRVDAPTPYVLARQHWILTQMSALENDDDVAALVDNPASK
ncbi:monofunctional biosynthetic peptidoglycan transglycosylase [Dinghuibacter silviterrae]|uniref:Biosynthetic peptidoglycan transglycosylase n=1 Tax=Dinghuibacter silviterrae TaxID=1539049 RepID=A0A4V3GLH6_9BACT|nr:monofunctional biosynthetic peptidoglycan transglycosylase [Dinghuibacter silviterrae]TDW99582.1 monofunctional biosynthetic peptidoglycan transglycosylase [Dinghuibacter silviterrae]